MAECLARSRIQARVSHISVASAAVSGGTSHIQANTKAVEEMRQRGLDLSNHRVQSLNEDLVRDATHIYAMSRHHVDAIVRCYPHAAEKTDLLKMDGTSISDPFMCAQEVYKECANEIEEAVSMRIKAFI